jgi:hypothetical protein
MQHWNHQGEHKSMAETKTIILNENPEFPGYLVQSIPGGGTNHIENLPTLSEAVGLWIALADDLRRQNGNEPIASHILTLTPLSAEECRNGPQQRSGKQVDCCGTDLPCLRIVDGSIIDETELRSRSNGSFAVRRLSRPMSAGQLRRWRAKHGYTQERAADLFRLSLKTLQHLEQRDPFDAALWGPISVICELLHPLR